MERVSQGPEQSFPQGLKAGFIMTGLSPRLGGLSKSLAFEREQRVAEAKAQVDIANLSGTTEVVPCYKAHLLGVLQQAIKAAVMLGGLALIQAAVAQSPLAASASSVKSGNSAANFTDVPPLPGGKSTILGGQIRDIDPVRDRFVLHVYGEKPMKILFDARTQLFVDGNRIALHDLKPAEHASVQTTLDGDKVFALSVHILSGTPQGAFEGRILDYDPGSGMLTVFIQGATDGFGQQIRVRVTNETTVKREGQTAFTAESRGQSDLAPGALVSLDFQSDYRGQGAAQQIRILATPGASFVFSGAVTALNVAGGYMVVLDPRDQRSYQIRFNPQDPVVLRLRMGDHVRVAANYDGTRYAATRLEETGNRE